MVNKKQKKTWASFFKRLVFFILAVSFLGVSFWVLFLSDYTQLKEIGVESETLDQKDLTEIIERHQNDFYFQHIPKNNFFIFPRKKVEKELKEDFKKIREIKILNNFPNEIIFAIEERKEIVSICEENSCFLVDERGEVFYQIPEEERDLYSFVVIKNNSLNQLIVGETIEDKEMIRFASEVKNLLNDFPELKIKRETETPSLISKEIRIETEEGWKVYFNTENDLSNQINLLKELLENSISKKERESLEYVDLRMRGKAIYKSQYEEEKEDKKSEQKDN